MLNTIQKKISIMNLSFRMGSQVFIPIILTQMSSHWVLESVSSARQINNNPLNTSRSKQLYSFSKDARFKMAIPYCDNIYEIPSHFPRTASALHSPRAPSARKRSPSDRFDNRVLQIGPTYTMRKKLKVIDRKMSIQPQDDNPGAGAYQNPQALSPRGSYFVGKHKSTSITKFNPRSSQRFFQFKNLNPGPGRYDQINQLSDSGRYSLSKTNGFGKRIIDKQRRVVKFQFQSKKNYNPGPGSYRSPSDFGNYDGNVYDRTGGISYIAPITRRPSRSRF